MSVRIETRGGVRPGLAATLDSCVVYGRWPEMGASGLARKLMEAYKSIWRLGDAQNCRCAPSTPRRLKRLDDGC
jgi:hypothetical protein